MRTCRIVSNAESGQWMAVWGCSDAWIDVDDETQISTRRNLISARAFVSTAAIHAHHAHSPGGER